MALRKNKGAKTGNFNMLAQLFGSRDNQAGSNVEGLALNQPVSNDYEPANYSGPQEFYSPSGQVTTTPAIDTRNWLQRNITGQPNNAGRINTQAALADIQGRMGNLSALEGEKQKAAFENSQFPTKLGQRGQELEQSALSDVSKQKQLGQLAIDQGPQPNLEPGAVDFRFSGDPTNRELYPFKPDTAAGMNANAKMAEEASLQKFRESAITENQRPRYINENGTLIRLPDTAGGTAQPEITVEPGFNQDTKPIFGPDGKTIVGISPATRIPSRIINRRPVGNAYGGGGGNIQPSALSNSYSDVLGLRGPASTQRQEFVTATNPSGGPPSKVTSIGQPPATDQPYDYGRPMAAPQHRLRPGGNPQRLQEQVAGQTSPTMEISEEEKLTRALNRILQGLNRY